jgi:hypothetical protein
MSRFDTPNRTAVPSISLAKRTRQLRETQREHMQLLLRTDAFFFPFSFFFCFVGYCDLRVKVLRTIAIPNVFTQRNTRRSEFFSSRQHAAKTRRTQICVAIAYGSTRRF